MHIWHRMTDARALRWTWTTGPSKDRFFGRKIPGFSPSGACATKQIIKVPGTNFGRKEDLVPSSIKSNPWECNKTNFRGRPKEAGEGGRAVEVQDPV